MQGFQLIINFLIMPLYFFSNALFPTAGLPVALRWAVRFNPLTYGVDGLRAALIGNISPVIAIDFVVLAALAMLLLSIASYLFSRIQA